VRRAVALPPSQRALLARLAADDGPLVHPNVGDAAAAAAFDALVAVLVALHALGYVTRLRLMPNAGGHGQFRLASTMLTDRGREALR
jgi:hypothetical protein